MNTIVRWLVWIGATTIIVLTGFEHRWDTLHKVLLGIIIVLGVLQLVAPIMQRRMVQKIKAMPPEEREKFLSRFDPRTQERLRRQLNSVDV